MQLGKEVFSCAIFLFNMYERKGEQELWSSFIGIQPLWYAIFILESVWRQIENRPGTWNFFHCQRIYASIMADRMSSEQIAKALKGAGLSTEQRIVTATEAWRNVQLFFPNKDDFLLDWLCGALTMTKTNK